jgi:hypothetical protein
MPSGGLAAGQENLRVRTHLRNSSYQTALSTSSYAGQLESNPLHLDLNLSRPEAKERRDQRNRRSHL